jgi:hypothetical protein
VDDFPDRVEGATGRVEDTMAFIREGLDPLFDSSIGVLGDTAICCKDRGFFTTHKGHISIASRGVKPGDRVCVLLGCRGPLILRPTEHKQYEVAGESYVQGLMYGEALLGSLPQGFHAFAKYFKNARHHRGFVDSITQEFQFEDPRLEPLLKGWRMRPETEERTARFYNDEEDISTLKDPRLSSDASRARRVKLETFGLIRALNRQPLKPTSLLIKEPGAHRRSM